MNTAPCQPRIEYVTVCDNCLKACCWQGMFMCDDARTAGTTVKTKTELRKRNLEHESYWS